jgi:hypothetical protein
MPCHFGLLAFNAAALKVFTAFSQMMLSGPVVPRFALCAAGDTAATATGGGGAVSTQDCVDAIRIDFIGLGVQVLINPPTTTTTTTTTTTRGCWAASPFGTCWSTSITSYWKVSSMLRKIIYSILYIIPYAISYKMFHALSFIELQNPRPLRIPTLRKLVKSNYKNLRESAEIFIK